MSSTVAIQLSIFALYGSATFVTPYLSLYLLKYTNASHADIGYVETVSSASGILFRLIAGSFADRHKAHRPVYLLSTILFLSMGFSLILPIVFRTNHEQKGALVVGSVVNKSLASNEILDQLERSSTMVSNSFDIEPLEDHLNEQTNPPFQWFYVVFLVVVIGQIGCRVGMNLSDAFCANVALRTGKTYGSIRFYGAIGRTLASLIVILLMSIEPYLLPSLCSMIILTIFNFLIILLWPNNEPFDLSSLQPPANSKQSINQAQDESVASDSKIKFRNKTIQGLFCFPRNKQSTGEKSRAIVNLTKANLNFKFDTREEDMFRNIRRCSLAPLGDSYLIKQFELDLDLEKNVKYFNHVTKIEPMEVNNCEKTIKEFISINHLQSQTTNKEKPLLSLSNQNEKNLSFEWPNSTSSSSDDGGASSTSGGSDQANIEHISFRLYLRILLMIGKENKNVIRFMFLYVINGIAASSNWTYLFPYLKSFNEQAEIKLSAYIMMSRYLSETLFYHYMGRIKFFKLISHSNGINLILLVYVIRYILYTLLDIIFPLELVILIETLRALNTGWLNCILNEAAIEFANVDAKNCVKKLIDLKVIDMMNVNSIDKIENSFKATIVVISSCCYDGLGMALGATISGLIVTNFGFQTLWLSSAIMCLAASFFNVIIEQYTSTKMGSNHD